MAHAGKITEWGPVSWEGDWAIATAPKPVQQAGNADGPAASHPCEVWYPRMRSAIQALI